MLETHAYNFLCSKASRSKTNKAKCAMHDDDHVKKAKQREYTIKGNMA